MEFYHVIIVLENNNIKRDLILLKVMLKFMRKQLEINN